MLTRAPRTKDAKNVYIKVRVNHSKKGKFCGKYFKNFVGV